MAHTWSAQSRWECMERNAQRSSVLEFFVSCILTFLPHTLCSTTVNGTTRLLRTHQSRHLADFLSCMQISVLCHFSMDYVRLSHFSSVNLFHSHVLVTDETLVFVEES